MNTKHPAYSLLLCQMRQPCWKWQAYSLDNYLFSCFWEDMC